MRTATGSLLARHQLITLIALAILIVLAWIWLLAGAGMEMVPHATNTDHPADHNMGASMPMPMDGVPEWSTDRLALTFAMWWIMMVAMMLPSAAPVILLYARASEAVDHALTPATGSFLGGYIAIWGLFAAAATALQIGLQQSSLLSSAWMRSESTWLTAGLLLLAGVYQLSPAKGACLRQCRNPAQFISRYFRKGRRGAWRMGAIHGAYCVGCCWSLMVLLFVGGVMNLVWIAVLTLLVAAEKLLPLGRHLPVVTGVALIVGALVLIAANLLG